jgi:hypothetical protein
MAQEMKTSDILIRSVAALVVLGCGIYFVFGLAVAAAAYQPGTAIHHYEPVTLPMLWHEASKVSFSAVVRWLRTDGDGCGVWFMATVGLWFLAALLVAFTLAVNPRLFSRSKKALGIAGLIIGLGSLFGLLGLYNLFFTFLNAFALRGLDGEWVIELGPVLDAVGILYLVACLLVLRSWFSWIRGRTPSTRLQADGSATA